MSDPLIGERWTNPPRYIDHPDDPFSDGDTFDAGAEMLIRNNLAHLAEESMRQLVLDTGADRLSKSLSMTGWVGLADDADADAGWSRPATASISWDQRTANRYGPFPLIVDRTIPAGTGPADGALTIRKIRVRLDVDVTDALTTLFAALTIGDGNVSPVEFFAASPSDTFGLFKQATPGVTTTVVEFDLECTVRAEQFLRSPFRCRPDASHGASDSLELAGYLWVGALYPAGVTLYSVSAYEIL